MKRKIRVIMINICLIAFFFLFVYLTLKIQKPELDLAKLNDQYQSVELALDQGANPEELMEKYDCIITYCMDEDYLEQTYGAIRDNDIQFDLCEQDRLVGKVIIKRVDHSLEQNKKLFLGYSAILTGGVLLIVNLVSILLYVRVIRPFEQLQQFTRKIAAADFSDPLVMNKHNYFGAFTESFDLMREELMKAREGENRANRSKKELVASLSHDIKTPVATIKAICEVLEVKMKADQNVAKIQMIEQKADLIDHLISNMFHATLEELSVLKIEATEEMSSILPEMFHEMDHFGLIHYCDEVPSCLIFCDKLRLTQVIGNVLSNSYKYANTQIDVTFSEDTRWLYIEIRDYGNTADEADLFLVCEKFYRGANAKEKEGSGLGLFLAKQFMEGFEGAIRCESDNGFVVTLKLKKVGKDRDLRNG